ncbi:LuxR C-terminal-related transcriptional regulator [Luteimicrobium sp. NPDC057192]|uniref:helix-turn-helix transcriptional regulator n=1 Tax=Luteimicrobium sp. NPDC057192 TaxID=3346042 RepID=UPI00363EF212
MPAGVQDRPGGTTTSHAARRESAAPPLPRARERERARTVVGDGYGGIVWRAEPGGGRSSLLDEVLADLTAERDVAAPPGGGRGPVAPPVPLVVRVGRAAGERPGAFVRALVEGVVAAVGATPPAVPTSGPDDAERCPEAAAALFADAVGPLLAGRSLVVAVDDLDLLDPDCQEVLGQVVSRRARGVVVLATAGTDDDATLPRALEVRDLPGLGPVETVALLAARGTVVAPHVAARLARDLVGNPAALVQTAALLSGAQLAGSSALPDPLPVVPAVRDVVGKSVDRLDESERHVLLVASVAATQRTDVLLAATGRSTDELLRGGAAAHLDLVASRYRFADPRVRALVHGEATLAERTAAHDALARAVAGADPELAAWHVALATLEGDSHVADGLVVLARRHLHHGDAGAAFEVAREAASHAVGRARRRALELAAASALAAGCVQDATHWARGAMRGADPDEAARVLPTFVVAVTLSEGQVPLDAVERAVSSVLVADPRTTARPVAPWAKTALRTVRAAVTAARLLAERGEGRSARSALADAERVAEALQAAAPLDEVTAAASGRAQAALAAGRVAADVFRVQPGGARETDVVAPLAGGADASTRAVAGLHAGLRGDLAAASSALANALLELAPLDGEEPWDDGTAGASVPLAEAHLWVAKALVDTWAGDLRAARAELEHAAVRVPVALPFAGLGAVLACRLDLAATGATGPVGAALTATVPGPRSRPVRHGALADRALAAVLERRYDEAATLVELAEQRERAVEAQPLPLPVVDEVCAWERAGRRAEALAARDRLRERTAGLPADLRDAAVARADVLVAPPEQLAAAVEVAVEVSRRLASPYERARTELAIGRALARTGDVYDATSHLFSAVELFRTAGAAAWERAASDDLRALDGQHEPTAPVTGQVAVAPPSATGVPADGTGPGAMVPAAGMRASGGVATPGPGAAQVGGPAGAVAPDAVVDALRARLHERWGDLLTERELDVALLVVDGASNKEVAEWLFVSVRTVEVHLGRVFRKLGVRSRVELTVVAHRG